MKNFLLIQVSFFALGNVAYGATLALEDDSREGVRPVVGEHLYGALEDRAEADRLSRFEKEIAEDQARKEAGVSLVGDLAPQVTRSLEEVIDFPSGGVIELLYKIVDEDGIETTETKTLPRQEAITWTHDDTNHFSIPTIRAYGVTEEGEILNAGDPRVAEPLRHEFVSVVSDNSIGDSRTEDGKTKTRMQKTVKYRRVGVDDVEYTVVEDPRIEEIPLPSVAAPAQAPGPVVQHSGGGGPRRGLFGIGRAWRF